MPNLTVRPSHESDIDLIADYWLKADAAYMQSLGVDLAKMPKRAEWQQMLQQQLTQDYPDKQSYGIVWELDGRPVGHSNINKIVFGSEAYMHIHIWYADVRKLGYGATFIRQTIPYFFEHMQLKKLYCEPYALNSAPNKILQKVGFTLVDSYTTTPGWINFEQPVNLWCLTKAAFEAMH